MHIKSAHNTPEINQYPEQMKIDLTNRSLNYNRRLEIDFTTHLNSPELLKEVVHGETIILANTHYVRQYLDQFIRWRDMYTVSEHKYFNLIHGFKVSKYHGFNQFIKFM